MKPSSAKLVLMGCLTLPVICPKLDGRRDDRREQAEALLARGAEASDIRAEGSPHFRLFARVRMTNAAGQVTEGEYEENWISPTEWRRATRFPEYTETEVRRGDHIWRWQSGSEQYEPYDIRQLKSCFELSKYSGLAPVGTRRSIKKVTAGSQMECVESQDVINLLGEGRVSRTVCYDPLSGRILRAEDNSSGLYTQSNYENYERFGQKWFPHHIIRSQGRRLIIEADVIELVSPPALDPSLLTVPPGADGHVTCDRPKPPRPLYHPDAPSPETGRANGRVLVYAVVGVDGRVHNVTAIKSDGPELAASAVETISQLWRFDPATCADQPGPAELFIQVDFHPTVTPR
jgi:hypothetical protein